MARCDVMRTVVEHIAQQVAVACSSYLCADKQRVIIACTGGGSMNTFLMERLHENILKRLPQADIRFTLVWISLQVIQFSFLDVNIDVLLANTVASRPFVSQNVIIHAKLR